MKIPIIRKIKGSRWPTLCYMTYVLMFQDGDQWVKQTEFSGQDLDLYLRNMINEHKNSKTGSGYDWKNRAIALWKVGECWWKDPSGLEHLILIEMKKRPSHQLKWGVSKEGFLNILEGVDEFGQKKAS